MNNKKGLGLTYLPLVFLGMAWIMVLFLVVISTYSTVEGEKTAMKICDDLNMEILDYTPAGFFTEESITCWNKTTKEIKRIK